VGRWFGNVVISKKAASPSSAGTAYFQQSRAIVIPAYEKGGYALEHQDETVPQPRLWTISQVCQALNLGRTKIYELIWKEHLPVQKFGRAVRVSPVELQRWLEERGQP
jgi:excisionase family DNA binding protein